MAASDLDTRLQDLARIAFVTQRFHALQGLIPAMLGAGLIAAPLMAQAIPLTYFTPAGVSWNFATMFCVLAIPHLQRIYRHTYGAAVATTKQQFTASAPLLLVIVGGAADVFVETRQPGPSFAAIALTAGSIWTVARDWRWRVHHLIPAAAGIIAGVITAAAPPLRDVFAADPARTAAHLLSFTILGVGIVAAGLLDHRLLASCLAPASTQTSRARRVLVRSESGPARGVVAGVFCVASAGALWGPGPDLTALALPMAIFLALLANQMLLAMFQIAKAVWGGPSAATPPVLGFHLSADSLALLFAVAVAAAFESAIGGQGLTLLAVVIGGTSGWIAVRDWPYRGHYLIGAAIPVAVLFVGGRNAPTPSLAGLVFVTSAALTVEGLFDYLVARRHRGTGVTPGNGQEAFDVDAI